MGINGELVKSLPIIHPIWVIDEYAKMARIWDWFIPMIPPIIAFIVATRNKMGFILGILIKGKISKVSGPNFCHVHKIRQLIHDIDDIVDGSQKWHGAAPNFNSRAVIKSVCISNWFVVLYKNILE